MGTDIGADAQTHNQTLGRASGTQKNGKEDYRSQRDTARTWPAGSTKQDP